VKVGLGPKPLCTKKAKVVLGLVSQAILIREVVDKEN